MGGEEAAVEWQGYAGSLEAYVEEVERAYLRQLAALVEAQPSLCAIPMPRIHHYQNTPCAWEGV